MLLKNISLKSRNEMPPEIELPALPCLVQPLSVGQSHMSVVDSKPFCFSNSPDQRVIRIICIIILLIFSKSVTTPSVPEC